MCFPIKQVGGAVRRAAAVLAERACSLGQGRPATALLLANGSRAPTSSVCWPPGDGPGPSAHDACPRNSCVLAASPTWKNVVRGHLRVRAQGHGGTGRPDPLQGGPGLLARARRRGGGGQERRGEKVTAIAPERLPRPGRRQWMAPGLTSHRPRALKNATRSESFGKALSQLVQLHFRQRRRSLAASAPHPLLVAASPTRNRGRGAST